MKVRGETFLKNQNFHSQKRLETEKESDGSDFDPGERKQEGFINGSCESESRGEVEEVRNQYVLGGGIFQREKDVPPPDELSRAVHADFSPLKHGFGDVPLPQKRRQRFTEKIIPPSVSTIYVSLFFKIALPSSSVHPCDEL